MRIYYQGNYKQPKELKYKILEEQPKAEIVNAKLLNKKVDKIKQKYSEQNQQENWEQNYQYAN